MDTGAVKRLAMLQYTTHAAQLELAVYRYWSTGTGTEAAVAGTSLIRCRSEWQLSQSVVCHEELMTAWRIQALLMLETSFRNGA